MGQYALILRWGEYNIDFENLKENEQLTDEEKKRILLAKLPSDAKAFLLSMDEKARETYEQCIKVL